MCSETQQKLLKHLMENPDLLPPEQREQLMKDLIANIGNFDRYYLISIYYCNK